MIEFIEYCRDDPDCSTQMMHYWYEQLGPDAQFVDQEAWQAMQDRGYDPPDFD